MMDEATIPTWEFLRRLGFQPDSKVISDVMPGLSFDFGYLGKLSASCVASPRNGDVVLFTGTLSARGSAALINFELSRRMTSLKQCAAWIVWILDQFRPFKETCHVDWVEQARQNKSLLPLVRSKGEYDTRPQCIVQRNWLRLALKTLSQQLSSLPDHAAIVFSFDGSVLFIRCDNKVIALPGEGIPWSVRFSVAAKSLRSLPKRFRREIVWVSVWQSRISLGDREYEGTLKPSGTTNPSSLQ